jgi:hypothetical protein
VSRNASKIFGAIAAFKLFGRSGVIAKIPAYKYPKILIQSDSSVRSCSEG